MSTGRFLSGCLLAASFAVAPAGAQTVVVTDAAELVAAIEGEESSNIEVEGVIELDRYQATDNALPAIGDEDSQAAAAQRVTIRGRDGAELRAASAGFRLVEVLDNGRLVLTDITVSGFDSPEPGGAVLVREGKLELERVVLQGNRSDSNGGAILARGQDADLKVTESQFLENVSALRGGAVNLYSTDSKVEFERNRFVDNQAIVGCAVSLRHSQSATFSGNVFRGGCDQALVDANLGRHGHHFFRNTWVASDGLAYRYRLREADSPLETRMGGNLLLSTAENDNPVCRGDVSGDLLNPRPKSLGTNVATDASCELSRDTDQVVADASQLVALSGLPLPLEGGPALDADELKITDRNANEARCGIADARGLGRPQDGDGDGVPECDRGAIEKRNGPDIGAEHSGAYFDPTRSGEGYFVDILEDGRAWVTMFTYQPIGGSPAITEKEQTWFFGLGRVVGNSVVVPSLDELTGIDFATPVPGIPREHGGLSLVFSDCEAGQDNPGTAYFRSNDVGLVDVPALSDLFTDAVRLTSVVPCGDAAPSPKAGLSGNFFDPERSGEGIQVQWLPDGRVLVVWYTFAPEGGPIWMISDGATVENNTVTAPMIYPAEPTAFGPDFDPSEIGLEPWGTLTLEYTDCDTIEFGFDSEIEGFGSGSFTYRRLTQPAGTTCESLAGK